MQNAKKEKKGKTNANWTCFDGPKQKLKVLKRKFDADKTTHTHKCFNVLTGMYIPYTYVHIIKLATIKDVLGVCYYFAVPVQVDENVKFTNCFVREEITVKQ